MRFIIVYDRIKLDFYLVTRTSNARKKKRNSDTWSGDVARGSRCNDLAGKVNRTLNSPNIEGSDIGC